MLQFLQYIFGYRHENGGHPESLVREAIEQAVERTDPWLKAVSGYRRKLRPAVICSLDYVAGLANSLAPPIHANFDKNGSAPSLSAFFSSPSEMHEFFRNDRSLALFLRDNHPTPKQVTALLIMQKSEKTIFGAELSGDVVVRDVPQVSVSFHGHRLLGLATEENETRTQLQRLAFDHLLTLAIRKITSAKTKRKDLERRRTLLQSKLTLLQRNEGGGHDSESTDHPTVAETEDQLKLLEDNLLELGREDRVLDAYLDTLIQVLSHPDEQLWDQKQCLILDQSGIKRTQTADHECELTLHELYNSEGRWWVISLVTLSVDELLRIIG
jgi:hypothetical protein